MPSSSGHHSPPSGLGLCNKQKSELELRQTLCFTGAHIDTREARAFLPLAGSRFYNISAACYFTSKLQLLATSVTGSHGSVDLCSSPARLYMCPLQWHLRRHELAYTVPTYENPLKVRVCGGGPSHSLFSGLPIPTTKTPAHPYNGRIPLWLESTPSYTCPHRDSGLRKSDLFTSMFWIFAQSAMPCRSSTTRSMTR